MKRLTLMIGAIAIAVVLAPFSARAQSGCNWWDLTCNGLAPRVSDYGWHIAGRDQAGSVVYLRRRVDSNGNVIIEQARRNDYGRYLVVNNHTIRKGTVYGPNGEICKYDQNDKGYKEECKYAKVNNVYKPSKYEPPKVHTVKYEPPKVHTVKYETPKVHTVKYKAPKVHTVKYEAPKGAKVKGEKGKGPKH
jgi:hypothetical protein